MSKSQYLCCKSLNLLPKFASKTQQIQVGNRQFVSVLFIIPITVDIHGHRFEIYMLVSEIHENVDVVLGIKNVSELEGIINSQVCCFNFSNRLIPIFLKECIALKSREQKLIRVDAQFIDEISGLAINKILANNVQNTVMLKLKLTWNLATLDITNSSLDTIMYDPKEMLGILDVRSLGLLQNKARHIATEFK